ncbi:MAG: Asp-tRNA(Asn)/Glu-tRNA(Gln) amidotransferase subunit GatA [Candidatus Sumerlaeota bacterium]|nr:Asp-tRNA(Asn)/Glu-tRNA(Gln) amidotransferase subunit GatA [Candidatus Sumerlaeota bacterium]
MDLPDLSAFDAARLLNEGQCSSVELTRACLERIERVEPRVRAFVTVLADQALDSARQADQARAQGKIASPLMGVPVAVKDNMCMRDAPTTCSSKILENFIPPYDATVVQRLTAAGMVVVGKTNLDEFAMGSSTENSGLFTTHNPWDLERAPGGSSGGSTAAVAAGEALLALGSDTGGSIRQPASLCGLVGLKPTYGRVSRYGLVAFASSLDQIGPITRTARDAALLMNVIGGHDPLDSTSWPEPAPNYCEGLDRGVRGLRIGVPKEYFIEGIDPEVEAAVRQAIEQFAALGAEAAEVSLPTMPYAIPTYYICATAEASSNLARYDGAHYGLRVEGADNIIDMFSRTRAQGFGAEVKRRIMLGTYALSAGFYDAYYMKGLKARTLFKRDFERAFEKCDVILGPTTPTPAFQLGEKVDDPIQMYLCDIFTTPANLAGNPALSIPCGFSAAGLPIGLQLIAPLFDEARLLQTAHAFEQATDYHKARANLAAD